MASLQIPFSRWDWPNSDSNEPSKPTHSHNHNHNGHSHSSSLNHNHRSDVNCSHPKSNPVAASLSSLSAMLLEGQAVLAHQTPTAIWLFIGLSNGSIWKWSINMVTSQNNSFYKLYLLYLMFRIIFWLQD